MLHHDKFWGYHAKWNMPVTKINTIWSHLFKEPSQTYKDKSDGFKGNLIGIEFQFCKMKQVLWMDGGNGKRTMWT